MKNLDILYEDNYCIVINKPAGLAVQGGKGVKSSLDKILAKIRTPAPLLVHRLDKDTSGIVLTAKDRGAAAGFSRLLGGNLKQGGVKKQYIAVCAGCPKKTEGIITDELLIHGKMKRSETKYKVIKRGKIDLQMPDVQLLEFSVLEIELGTGRMHQIRRHLALIGNPILGDDKYGDFSLNKNLKKSINLKRLLLHAMRLTIDEQRLDIQAPIPEYFNAFHEGALLPDPLHKS